MEWLEIYFAQGHEATCHEFTNRVRQIFEKEYTEVKICLYWKSKSDFCVPVFANGWVKANENLVSLNGSICLCKKGYIQNNQSIILLNNMWSSLRRAHLLLKQHKITNMLPQIMQIIDICKRCHYTESSFLDTVLFKNKYQIDLPFHEDTEHEDLPDAEIRIKSRIYPLEYIKEAYPLEYAILKGMTNVK